MSLVAQKNSINTTEFKTYEAILSYTLKNIKPENKYIQGYIRTLLNAMSIKEKHTFNHIKKVCIYAEFIANKLNLSDKDKLHLLYGAYMHDIGKINIPTEILIKKTPLTNEEWLLLKQHPKMGYDMIKNVVSASDITYSILYHHERYDGTGYPNGLKGENIPYLARVLTVVDSFDAMTSQRSYNKVKTFEEGKNELIKCSGTQFDPEIVDIFIKNVFFIVARDRKKGEK